MSHISPKISPSSGRPRSNSYTSSIKEFQIGTKVLIVETENVIQRAPHLIGKVGVICEVPVHPATWFKVEFPEQQIVTTFRPSALKAISGDCDLPDHTFALPSNEYLNMLPGNLSSIRNQSASSRKRNQSRKNTLDYVDEDLGEDNDHNDLASHPELILESEGGDDLIDEPKTRVMLDTLDPEKWVGSLVRIIGGKRHGQEGKIIRSGNGWVQVLTTNGEDVPQRAHELQVLMTASGSLDRSANFSRKHKGHDHGHSMFGEDNDTSRPRRLQRKNGEIDDSRYPKSNSDPHSWAKDIKKSIHIDENYSCPPFRQGKRPRDPTCPQCHAERYNGAIFCWNVECPLSPLFDDSLAIVNKSLAPSSISQKHSSSLVDHESSSPRSSNEYNEGNDELGNLPSPPLVIKSTKPPLSPQIGYLKEHHISSYYFNSSAKNRSDSSMTDVESPSPMHHPSFGTMKEQYSPLDSNMPSTMRYHDSNDYKKIRLDEEYHPLLNAEIELSTGPTESRGMTKSTVTTHPSDLASVLTMFSSK